MDELDRQILDGSAARLEAGAAARLGRHLQKPLRTHALVLRAGDRRWIPGIPVSDDAERIELEGMSKSSKSFLTDGGVGTGAITLRSASGRNGGQLGIGMMLILFVFRKW